MNVLRQRIKKFVSSGGESSVGNSLAAHINRAIKRAMLSWTGPQVLNRPTTLQAVIAWEVNEYLSKNKAGQEKFLAKWPGSAEAAAKRKQLRVPTMGELFAKPATGKLIVQSLNPNVGRLESGKLVIFSYKESVSVKQSYSYWFSNGKYFVKGTRLTWVQRPYGIPFGDRYYLQQKGSEISSIWPDATSLDTVAGVAPILRGHNGFQACYSESEYATVEDTNYVEYRLAGTAEDPTAREFVFSISLTDYMPSNGRWEHSHPGKLLLYQDYAILSIVRIKDQETSLEPNYPILGTRAYAWHHVTAWIAYDLLVINRLTKEVRAFKADFSALNLQIMHTGYIDFLVNPISGKLIVAKIDSSPVPQNLTAGTLQYRVPKSQITPPPAEDVILKSRTEVASFISTYGAVNMNLEAAGGTKVFNYGAYSITVYEADISLTSVDPTATAIFTHSGVVSEKYGQATQGGYTHAILGVDPTNGSMFMLRGYEAYFQTPYLETEALLAGTGSTGGFVPSDKYKEGIYPGDICMFGGNKIIRLSDGLELADIPGENSVPFSALALDPIGQKALVGALTNASVIKKFLNTPRFSADATSEMLRARDLASLFQGGTNDGELYYDVFGSIRYINSANIYLNRARLIVMRDLTQPLEKQIRFVVQGIHHQVSETALDAHIVSDQVTTSQSPYLIIPNEYNALAQDLFGYTLTAFGYWLPLYDSFAVAPSTGYTSVTRMWLLKYDFLQPAPDQLYVLADGQVHIAWYGDGHNGIGDKIPLNFAECWQLKGMQITGWTQDMDIFSGDRKTISLMTREE